MNNAWGISALIVWIFSALPAPLRAEIPAPEFEVSLTAKTLRVGETTTLQISARWPKSETSYVFRLPDRLPLENLKVLRSGESQEALFRKGREWVQKAFEIELEPERPGKARIREFSLSYLLRSLEESSPGAPPSDFYRIPTQEIRVRGRAPKPVFWMLLGSGIAAAASGLGVWIGIQQKRERLAALPKPESPEDASIRKIREAASAMTEAAARDAACRAAAEFRHFLTGYFQLSSPNASEKEIREELRRKNAGDKELFALLDRFYDLKFSAASPDRLEVNRLVEGAVEWIHGRKIISQNH